MYGAGVEHRGGKARQASPLDDRDLHQRRLDQLGRQLEARNTLEIGMDAGQRVPHGVEIVQRHVPLWVKWT